VITITKYFQQEKPPIIAGDTLIIFTLSLNKTPASLEVKPTSKLKINLKIAKKKLNPT